MGDLVYRKQRAGAARLVLLGVLMATTRVSTAWSQRITEATADRVVIVVIDGLRPDYVTPEVMPTLAALREGGFSSDYHHSVVPTVTRVNAASLATGSYPRTHGLMGNSMYLPSVMPERAVNTGNVDELKRVEATFPGELLTAPSLGELLHERSKTLFVASSGSSGSGFLLNHRAQGGALVHHEYVVPDTLEEFVTTILGPAPPAARPNLPRVRRAVDALLQIGIDHFHADALIVWITEPDGTAHTEGVGAPPTLQVLGAVDREVGRLLAGLESRGLLQTSDIFVTTDHGFSTLTGTQSLTALLVEHGLKAAPTSSDVVLAGGAIHVTEGDQERIRAVVQLLQQTDWVGPVFTPAGPRSETEGWVPGTLSFATLLWNHPRSADILAMGNWTGATNEFGFPGAVMMPGVATHGSTSPYDIRATFIAVGPDIKNGVRSSVPTGNVDLAPTVLALLGVPIPDTMDGRVLREALRNGPDPSDVQVITREFVAETSWDRGRYRMVLRRSEVDGTTYVDFTEVTRH